MASQPAQAQAQARALTQVIVVANDTMLYHSGHPPFSHKSPIANRISEITPFASYVPGVVSGQILAGLFAAILSALSSLLRDQYAAGHRFFVGDRLSALDIYWAAFAALVEPLPADLCATPEYIRPFYVLDDAGVRAAADPLLLQHRDRIYNEHLELPVRL